MHRAVLRERSLRQRPYLGLVGDIGGNPEHVEPLGAQLIDGLGEPLGILAGEHQPHALTGPAGRAWESQPMNTRAALLETIPGRYEIRDVELDEPRAHEVLVRYVASGICHSDVHYLDRRTPGHLADVRRT